MTPDDLARIGDSLPAHYWECDRFYTYDYGLRDGVCDCSASDDVPALIAALRDAWAERDALIRKVDVEAHRKGLVMARALEAEAALAERDRLRTIEQDALGVLSVAFPTNTMPWLMDVGVAACVSLLASERDDARAELDAWMSVNLTTIHERDDARAALARVEALHRDHNGWCEECTGDLNRPVRFIDCATRAAMKGES